MKQRFLLLSLLCLTTFSAWADWDGTTHPATADETINATISVSSGVWDEEW